MESGYKLYRPEVTATVHVSPPLGPSLFVRVRRSVCWGAVCVCAVAVAPHIPTQAAVAFIVSFVVSFLASSR